MRRDDPTTDARDAEILEARARRLRDGGDRASTTEESALVWVAEFPLGSTTYAVELGVLRASLPLRLVTPVPLAPPAVVGILRFQGQLVVALSLASILGVRGWSSDPTVLLVVEAQGTLVAFDCERIPKPVGLPSATVAAARARAGPAAVAEVARPGGEPVYLVDPARLVATVRFAPGGASR